MGLEVRVAGKLLNARQVSCAAEVVWEKNIRIQLVGRDALGVAAEAGEKPPAPLG